MQTSKINVVVTMMIIPDVWHPAPLAVAVIFFTIKRLGCNEAIQKCIDKKNHDLALLRCIVWKFCKFIITVLGMAIVHNEKNHLIYQRVSWCEEAVPRTVNSKKKWKAAFKSKLTHMERFFLGIRWTKLTT